MSCKFAAKNKLQKHYYFSKGCIIIVAEKNIMLQQHYREDSAQITAGVNIEFVLSNYVQ
jgi:hypothetical protein